MIIDACHLCLFWYEYLWSVPIYCNHNPTSCVCCMYCHWPRPSKSKNIDEILLNKPTATIKEREHCRNLLSNKIKQDSEAIQLLICPWLPMKIKCIYVYWILHTYALSILIPLSRWQMYRNLGWHKEDPKCDREIGTHFRVPFHMPLLHAIKSQT